MSAVAPFASFGVRFVASDWQTTYRPLALIEGALLPKFPSSPSAFTLAHAVVCDCRSTTTICETFGVEQSEMKATYLPSADMDGVPPRVERRS